MQRDPLTTTQNATNVGTDVSVGPGETLPELEGDRRPGGLADDPESPPAPGENPGSNPDNPGDDPGLPTPKQPPDVFATDPAPPDESGAGAENRGRGAVARSPGS